ncbi:unnamed protein product, partial [Iphiclides podalirius]
MIGLRRFVVWISVFHVSTQNNITRPSYNLFKRNGSANGNNLSINEIQSRRTASKGPNTIDLFVPKITEHCEIVGICEDVPGYPEEHVKRLLEETERLNLTRFSLDVMEPQIGPKIQNDDYLQLCESEQKIIAPRAARDVNNKWHFIVNRQKEPQQKFQVEICNKPSASCAAVVSFARGYRGRCQQKSVLRIMTAIDNKGELVEKAFLLPSCCSCVYEVVYYTKK